MAAEKTLLKSEIVMWYVFSAEGTGQTDVGPQRVQMNEQVKSCRLVSLGPKETPRG